ncbi:MAG TPA: helix-turn-helix transcriptional regulator [Novosphingobium sp.]|nr:helix-turn-helix transcriptional regulator [Novosphingobium sp.]
MENDESDLIYALHHGVLERPLWQDFLSRFRACTNSIYATFTFRAFRNETVALHAGHGPPAELQALVAKRRLRSGMPFPGLHGTGTVGLEALFTTSEADEETRLRERLRTMGIEAVHIQQITDPNGMYAWLTCAGAAKHEKRTRLLMGRLAPHLNQALRTYFTLEQQRFGAAIAIEAAQRSAFGWLTLDEECRIVDQTAEMSRIFDGSDLLFRNDRGRLGFGSNSIGKEVREIVARFARDSSGKPRALILNRDPWMDLLIAPVQHRSIAAERVPVAILYLRSDRNSQSDRCGQLADLFGLSPRESQMAWALAQGLTIRDVAKQLGITLETARGYSKKVYAKMGSRGQAELVRTVLTSVLAIV